jgi:hypothetical protein
MRLLLHPYVCGNLRDLAAARNAVEKKKGSIA